MNKSFHVGDILSVIYVRMLSRHGIQGVYDILDFLTRDESDTHQLPRVLLECRPHLIQQFPHLDSPQVRLAVAELPEMQKRISPEQRQNLLLGWFSKLTCGKYDIEVSETYEVGPLPPYAHEFIDPES